MPQAAHPTDWLGAGIEAVLMHQELVRQRLLKVARALDSDGVRYAIVGGNAVAHFVGQVAPSAVRGTADVDILIRREDLPRAQEALGRAGFRYRFLQGIHLFLDGPRPREGVHGIIADEKVKPENPVPAPGLEVVERTEAGFAVIPFAKLVAMKLTAFRRKDQVHLDDMIEVGLLPGDVEESLAPPLRERLRHLIDNPE